MKFTLKDYQADAVADILANLTDAREDFHRSRPRRTAFSLTAATGAGKTVIASAVIEALFYGSADFDFEADPGAVVLWITNDPELNEQTRHRIRQASELAPNDFEVVTPSTIRRSKLDPRKVYLLNTQKLAKGNLLVRGGDGEHDRPPADLYERTFWDVVRNTVEDDRLTLYVVLDEAHIGFGKQMRATEKATIVRQIVNGAGSAPPVPIVLGISATPQQFDAAMQGAQDRTLLPNVVVDNARVQESGLLKDDIRIDFPAETGDFDTVLLRRSVQKVKAATDLWARYHDAQQSADEQVVPLLVVQVPNTPSDEYLLEAVQAIRDEWPELERDSIAHVFGEHTDLTLGTYTVPYIAPSDVQERTWVRVLLAKEAISTGWDCPRAEVLVSFRPAKDQVYITQMLGRMVRTPLARRIPGDDRLNSVECSLPRFDKKTAQHVAQAILGTDTGTAGAASSGTPRVLFGAVDMHANAAIPEAVWEAFDELPSETVPHKGASPVIRLYAFAHGLALDGIVPDAGAQVTRKLVGVLDGIAAQYKDEHAVAQDEVRRVDGETLIASIHSQEVTETLTFTEVADERALMAGYRGSVRVLGASLAWAYIEHLVDSSDEPDFYLAYLQLAALTDLDGVGDRVGQEADAITKEWFAKYRVKIEKELPDLSQEHYRNVRALSRLPERIAITRPKIRQEATQSSDGEPVETRTKHLMADADGNYPIGELNEWETRVVDTELARDNTVAWYRNPSRASADSLAIAYQDAQENWRRLCPDFIFFAEVGGGARPYIVDPHGHHLADALPKLRGLARYAEERADDFHRIEAVAVVNDTLRVLDLTKQAVRDAIDAATDAENLYVGTVADDYA